MNHAGNLATLVAEAASATPAAPALVTADTVLCWAELAQQLAGKAARLAQSGLRAGDRVAVHGGMSPFTVEALGALSWAGLVAVPLNTRLSPAELRQICEKADVGALLHEEAAVPAGLEDLAVIHLSSRAFTTAPTALSPAADDPDGLAAIVFTGGTTGMPKGVLLSNADLAFHGRTVRDWLGYGPDDRVLQSQPLFHVAGINQFHAVAMARAALVFGREQGVGGMLAAVREMGASAIGLVPTTLSLLLDRMEDGLGAGTLRNIVYGAAPITPDLMARARAALPGVRFCQLYGQTETGPVTALLPADHDRDDPARLRSCGRSRAGTDVAIFGPAGEPCPAGAAGEIRFRGAGLTRGYWRYESQTRALFAGEWLRSGDIGFLDGQGYLTIVDRLKDMIVTGGENVFGAEVEAVLAQHPAIRQVAVLGLPDPHWGEAVHAVIVADGEPMPTPADLAGHCRPFLAGYKIPRHFHFRRAPLPLSAVGKVLKSVLREELLAAGVSKAPSA